MTKKRTRNVFNQSDYKIISELYYLNKKEIQAPRLPTSDARRAELIRTNKPLGIPLRKALLRIAALW